MSNQDKVVEVHFVNDQKITLPSSNPETLLSSITNKEEGWFIHELGVFRREHVTYAYIKNARSNKARVVKPHGL